MIALGALVVSIAALCLTLWFGINGAAVRKREKSLEGPIKLRVGDAAPKITLATIDGSRVSARELYSRDSLLVFTDQGCLECLDVVDSIDEWAESLHSVARIVLVFGKGMDDTLQRVQELSVLRSVLVLVHSVDDDIYRPFGITQLPCCIAVGRGGIIQSSEIVGAARIGRYVEALSREPK